ncbi:MAG: 30S ribosomal protein S20 [Candidatus Colwellbacteria bacterium]|nr:30S ribosomal protein S20 [Candidatus Colwellbacteria bacterium]
MPNTKSAKKALRQNITNRARNLARKKQIRTTTKEYKTVLGEGSAEVASQKLSLVYKALDKAAKTGAIAKNKASRLKAKAARLGARS